MIPGDTTRRAKTFGHYRPCARPYDHRPHTWNETPDVSKVDWRCLGDADGIELAAIARAEEEVTAARTGLNAVVQQARAAGRSYAEIGAALGITRQAAWERFHHVDHQEQAS